VGGLCIVTIELDGTVGSWSAGAEQLLGWTADEAIGKPFPLDFELGRDVERVVARKDGTQVPVRLAATRLPTAIAVVIVDITEQRRAADDVRASEARFRALVENARDVTMVLDRDTVIRYVSPSCTTILGYEPGELEGRHALSLVDEADHPAVSEMFRTATASAAATPIVEAHIRHRDGSWRLMEGLSVSLFDDPAVRGLVVSGRDVTDRRRLEQRVRQAERLEAVGQLAGGIAHDFNNVLLVVRGYSSVLGSTLHDPQQLADVAEITKAVDRAAGLTRQLLTFGRRQVVRARPLDIAAVTRDVETLLRRSVTETIEVAIDLPGEPLPDVFADPTQIEQVLLNLVVNARDAIGGHGTITIAAREMLLNGTADQVHPPLQPGAYVALSVADTGCGIPDEVLPHLFEPFFSTKPEGVGSGLGLATVYGIALQAGGGVAVDTAPGAGATFTVYFPLARSCEDLDEESADEAEQPTHGSETILVVEDEQPVRELVRRVLEAAGYDVCVAESPAQALPLLAHTSIDLLLSDVVMPGMSGWELAERAREEQPATRLLMMSGYSHDVAAAPIPGVPLLAKPFSPEQLTQTVREALDERRPLVIGAITASGA
jgi:two-component system, cell cycle sensor histidine kinase and response regulator CckA